MKHMFRNIFFAALLVSSAAPATEQNEELSTETFSFASVVSVFLVSAVTGMAFHEGLAALIPEV